MPETNAKQGFKQFQRRYPRLYASRHVAKSVGQILLAVIGVGAFLILPLPEIPLPSISLPDLSVPDLPGWAKDIFKWGKFVVLIAVGVLLAINEIEKDRQRSGS